MRRPRAVCFDVYDTLVTLDDPAGRLIKGFAAHGVGVSRALAERAFAAEVAWYRDHALTARDEARLQALRLNCAGILGAVVAEEAPHRLGPQALFDILMGSLDFRLLPGALECLRTLRRWGIKMAVVSNWDCSLPGILEHLDLTRYFDAIVVSATVGIEKPDPRIWAPALATMGVSPTGVWHVGDEPEADVAGALAAGLTPILLSGEPAAQATRIASLHELLRLVTDHHDR